jgi:hypothetical protein
MLKCEGRYFYFILMVSHVVIIFLNFLDLLNKTYIHLGLSGDICLKQNWLGRAK